MPHKHKRREKDASTYDLPPTVIAKSLPTRDPKSTRTKNKKNQKNQKKKTDAPKTKVEKFETKRKNDVDDDTPKAFKRLMQFQAARETRRKPPSGLDTGEGRKRKRDTADGGKEESSGKKKSAAAEETPTAAPEAPKILPGEKLSDFAARVDRELPLSAMKKSGKPAGLEDLREGRQTKHEKRLRRLQQGWREEEANIREREEEEQEEREDNMEEELQLWKRWEVEAGKKKKKRGPATKKKNAGSDSDDDPDPWAKLNKRDRAGKPANPFDVAQAPPQLTKPKQKFKVRDGAKVDVANVPAAVGSLRRREELAGERRNIVEEYRRLMAERRK